MSQVNARSPSSSSSSSEFMFCSSVMWSKRGCTEWCTETQTLTLRQIIGRKEDLLDRRAGRLAEFRNARFASLLSVGIIRGTAGGFIARPLSLRRRIGHLAVDALLRVNVLAVAYGVHADCFVVHHEREILLSGGEEHKVSIRSSALRVHHDGIKNSVPEPWRTERFKTQSTESKEYTDSSPRRDCPSSHPPV